MYPERRLRPVLVSLKPHSFEYGFKQYTAYTHFLFSSLILDDAVSRLYGMDYVSLVNPITVEYILKVLNKV